MSPERIALPLNPASLRSDLAERLVNETVGNDLIFIKLLTGLLSFVVNANVLLQTVTRRVGLAAMFTDQLRRIGTGLMTISGKKERHLANYMTFVVLFEGCPQNSHGFVGTIVLNNSSFMPSCLAKRAE